VAAVEGVSPATFRRKLKGRRIKAIERRGKYLLLQLSGDLYLVVHLRMTGSLLLRRTGAPDEPYLRAVLSLDDGHDLRYADLRKLGRLRLVDDPRQVTDKLGPDALARGFTADYLRRAVENRRAPIKSVLMDQRALAGLGNIYADEALFAARVNPLRRADTLSGEEVKRIRRGIRDVLRDALGNRGSSFRDYVDANGQEGRHQFQVKVFRRTGQPCYVCGAEIQRAKVGGRSAHFCPRCQPPAVSL
jgi:formamidopyrimidine-DNA glycosylase